MVALRSWPLHARVVHHEHLEKLELVGGAHSGTELDVRLVGRAVEADGRAFTLEKEAVVQQG